MLDLDDVGAQDGELISGERAGQNMGDVDYADSLERSHRRALLQLLSIMFSIAKREARSRMVGPGGLPFRRVVNDLRCQLKLIAAIDPKSQFQNCQLLVMESKSYR
jgi:hypothetical protein